MNVLDGATAALDALASIGPARTRNLSWGPTIAQGFPERGHGWYRPWGRIEADLGATRTRRATLSVKTHDRVIAILASPDLTPEILSSTTWRRARAHRRRTSHAAGTGFAVVAILGAVLLSTVLRSLASPLAILALLALAAGAGIANEIRVRAAGQRADDELTAAGHSWREIELGDDGDALRNLLLALDALSYDWQRDRIDDATWETARDLTRAVAEEAVNGALIDENNPELITARDYIDHARSTRAPLHDN